MFIFYFYQIILHKISLLSSVFDTVSYYGVSVIVKTTVAVEPAVATILP